jgi:hypothetical protein
MVSPTAPSDAPGGSLHFCESSLKLCDQARQGFGLLISGEVTARQSLDLEAKLAQPFLREVDLPMDQVDAPAMFFGASGLEANACVLLAPARQFPKRLAD